MLIKEKKGNIGILKQDGKTVDWLQLEWYEACKRIMHKRTQSGREVAIQFLDEAQQLSQGDILFEDDKTIIAVDILAADTIVIKPKSMSEMAAVCYEIGNKHLPLFYEDDAVLVPYDMPLFKLLSTQGYTLKLEERKLLQPLKTTVSPHGTGANNETIFSKIMRLTTSLNSSEKTLKER